MRLLFVVLLAIALPGFAFAQGNETNATPAGNETTTTGNETVAVGEPAPEEPAGPIEIVLEGHQEGSAVFFTLAGETAKNPTLNVKPGQQVTLKLRVVSGFHNIHVEGGTGSPVIGEGDEASVTFTAPESGSLQYWCDPHKSSGMQGRISTGGAAPAPGGGADAGGEITGESVDLGTYDPACAGTQIPAAAARGETGGPVISDYIQRCKSGGSSTEPARVASGADYVIPGSFVLIALGIAGVVWVHKSYKP